MSRLTCRFQVKIGDGGITRNVSVRVQPWPWLPFLRFRVEADVSMPEGMAWDFSHSTYDPREADRGDPKPAAPVSG